MVFPVQNLTFEDVEKLRSEHYGTNGKQVEVTPKEVEEMQLHLQTIYTQCKVQYNFAQKICIYNKVY